MVIFEDSRAEKAADLPGAIGPEDPRAEILNAAAAAFMQKGFSATSIDDVADSLGATKGRIYHYYRSKTDLFLDVHLEALRQLLEKVGAIAARSDLPADQRLFEMCREHVIVFMTTIAYQKATVLGLNRFLLSITAPYQTKASQRVQNRRDAYEDLFASTIAEGVKAGLFRPIPPRVATKPLLGALNWTNFWYAPPADGHDSEVDGIATELATYCVKALINMPKADLTCPVD